MKVYEFGCREPVHSEELVEEQIKLAHRYYNQLIELDRPRRAAVEATLLTHEPLAIATAEEQVLTAQIDALREQIQQTKQRQRKDVETPDLDTSVRELRAKRREVYERIKTERRKAFKLPAIVTALQGVNERRGEMRRAARAVCGVYWGTYLQIEGAIDQAEKESFEAPRFRRWDGSGQVAVQIQGGLTAEELFRGTDTRLRIAPLPANAWDTRSSRRRFTRTRVLMRIGSTGPGNKIPIWGEWPVMLHRPLPADSVIKNARIVRTMIAGRARWKLQLTVDSQEQRRAAESETVCAIDVGWRVVEGGLRVAYWADSDGKAGSLVLDDVVLSALTKADSLRSIRDRNLEEIRPWLAAWLAARELPAWIKREAATLAQWRSCGRFARLARLWGEARWDGDAEGYEKLAAWAKQDRHLWQWEDNQRDKAYRRRREIYRVFAAQLAARCGVLVLEDFDKREIARQSAPEEDKDANAHARHNRVLAATSVLCDALIKGFQSRGRLVLKLPAAYTTQICHACGVVAPRTDALIQRCECGVEWDQDYNAARNLLTIASSDVPKNKAKVLASEKPKESKWSRKKREKRERDDEQDGGGAREDEKSMVLSADTDTGNDDKK